MPTRSKSVEMNKIVTNLEFICITVSVNPGALKLEKATPKVFSKKGVLENFAKLTEKDLCPSRHGFSTVSFTKFLKTLSLQNTSGRLLLTKKLDGQKV